MGWWWPPVSKQASRSEDNVVQTAAWLLGLAQATLNLPVYSWQAQIFATWRNNGKPWLYFNHVYFWEWGIALGVLFAVASRVSGGWQRVIVGIVLWRAAEILVWYTKLLFDKAHRVFLEVERNLLFLVGDSLIFVTALALLLETHANGDLATRWSDAFSAFTLNGSPDGYHGSSWATATGLLGTVAGLALLAAGLGIIIGIISARIETSQSDDQRAYTGPTRPAPPWMKRSDD